VALVSPLFLIPLENSAPYPYFIEEIVKAMLIFNIIKFSSLKKQLKLTLVMAFLFAFSENMFYLINFISSGTLQGFCQRCLLTTTLHLLTAIIILLPSQKKLKLIIPATIIAMIIHYFYNQLVLIIF
jgi:hypothetical protein